MYLFIAFESMSIFKHQSNSDIIISFFYILTLTQENCCAFSVFTGRENKAPVLPWFTFWLFVIYFFMYWFVFSIKCWYYFSLLFILRIILLFCGMIMLYFVNELLTLFIAISGNICSHYYFYYTYRPAHLHPYIILSYPIILTYCNPPPVRKCY